jgi:hypothetical protein
MSFAVSSFDVNASTVGSNLQATESAKNTLVTIHIPFVRRVLSCAIHVEQQYQTMRVYSETKLSVAKQAGMAHGSVSGSCQWVTRCSDQFQL